MRESVRMCASCATVQLVLCVRVLVHSHVLRDYHMRAPARQQVLARLKIVRDTFRQETGATACRMHEPEFLLCCMSFSLHSHPTALPLSMRARVHGCVRMCVFVCARVRACVRVAT
eukprot:6181472-Pleurochrysis_carterae.AAC.1